ncbi:MAG: tetratricopeptide repeat protein [Pseudomonadota bacterium]
MKRASWQRRAVVMAVVMALGLMSCESEPAPETRIRHPDVVLLSEQVRRTLENAVAQWRLRVRQSPTAADRAQAYAELGRIYLAHHFDHAAADALRVAVSDHSTAPNEYYFGLALAAIHRDDEALAAFERSLALSENAEVRFARAELRLRSDDRVGALSDIDALASNLESAAADETETTTPRTQAAWQMVAARALLLERRFDEATARVARARELMPDVSSLNAAAATLSRLQGNERAARRLLQSGSAQLLGADTPLRAALAEYSRGPAFFYDRAVERMRQRQFALALQDFAATVDIAPSDGQARLAYARALEVVGDIQGAEAQYRLAVNAETAVSWYFLGALYERQGMDEKSVVHYERAVALDGDYLPARVQLAHALFRSRDYADALTQYQFVADRHDNHLEARQYAGMAALMLGDCERAPAWFEAAVAVNANSRAALQGLARSFAVCSTNAEELSRAQDIGERLEETRPDTSAAETLAMVFAALNDFDRAKRLLELAIQRSGESPMGGLEDRLVTIESGERLRRGWLSSDPMLTPPRLTMRVPP